MLSTVCVAGHGPPPPHRLSKPPTNRSSSNLLAATKQALEPASPLISSDADETDGYFTYKAPTDPERRPRRNTRSKIRSYLYGQSHETGQLHSSEDEEGSPKSFATVVKRRLSRTDSSTFLQTSSLGPSPASSTSRLFMGDATGSDLNGDEAMKEQIKEKVWTDTLAAQNHRSSPVDNDKHPDSVMTPIRRRSLYTPGIATRSPEDILRKPPPPAKGSSQVERDYYYNPALPASSPLSRLANLRASNTGRSTPSELHYTHLGAMKLGTLRVTNGAASPVPRDGDTSPVPTSRLDTASQKDFHTASEGGRSEGNSPMARSSHSVDMHRTPEREPFDVVSSSTEFATKSGRPSVDLEPLTRGHMSPPRRESYGHGGIDYSEHVIDQDTPAGYKTIRRKPLPPTAISRQQDQASSIAMDYAADLPGNPFPYAMEAHRAQDETMIVTPQEDTNRLQAFTQLNTQDSSPGIWRAFIHAAEQRHADNDSREDAFLKLTGSHKGQEERRGVECRLQDRPIDDRQEKYFQHADSGYGSNTSLESTESDPVPRMSSPRHDRPRSAYLPEGSALVKSTRKSHNGNNDYGTDKAPIVTCLQSSDTGYDPVTDIPRSKSSLGLEKQSLRLDSPQEHLPSPDKSRKLQKKRPKSQPPLQRVPMSAHDDSTEYEIPPVPTTIADLHSERMTKFPLLDHTYPSPQHTNADDWAMSSHSMAAETFFPSPTHGADNSRGKDKPSLLQKLASRARSRSRSRPREKKLLYQSDEESLKSDIMRSPSWSEYGNKKQKEQKKKDKAERELQKRLRRESSAERKADSRSQSKTRSKSRSRGRSFQHESSPTLTDFGTVKDSLGAGPYDIARSNVRAEHDTASKGLHPHQISTHMPSVQGSEGMLQNDDGHGRQRNHKLAMYTEEVSQNKRMYDCVSPKPSRPHSMFVGTNRPPVPALPVADWRARNRGNVYRMSMDPGEISTQQLYQASPATSILDLKPRANAQQSQSSKASEHTSRAPLDAPSGNQPASMDELVDMLLDAPDAETKEKILQQMRQQRRGLAAASGDACRPASGVIADASETATPSKSQDPPQTKPVNSSEPRNTAPKPEDHNRPQSMFADAPPMPPLPSAEHLQQQESRRSTSRYEQNRTMVPPQIKVPEAPKPDLWAGSAMETEHKKATKPDTDWESHRQAWLQRRRSAGEALLSKDRPIGLIDSPYKAVQSEAPEESAPQPTIHRAETAGLESLCLPQTDSKAFHRPWAAPQDQQIPYSHSTSSLQLDNTTAAAAQAFQRLTGRYEGGLQYGYEPGFGLGGSAGTRSKKTGATRKSIHVSQGFGVDLSDVPIFIAPSK